MARAFGLEVEEIGPSEIKAKWPLLNIDDVVGGIFLPETARPIPADTAMALIKGATARGARVFENVKVTSIKSDGKRVRGVVTDEGEIAADVVVLATGLWTRALAKSCGVSAPLHACEHFYIVTEPFPGLAPDLPVLRDTDDCAYYKEDAGKLLLGAFEPEAKPWALDGIPEDFEFDELPEDFEHFTPILEAAMRRLPALAKAGIRKFFNGPESFTPDVRYMLGEAPELERLYVAAGFNSIGIQSAGGAGKALAEWIIDGHPPMDLWDVDIRRIAAVPGEQSLSRRRASPNRSACSTPCTGPTASTRPRAACGFRRCISASPIAAPVSARSRVGSAPTGSRPRARRRRTSIATAGRTGSRIPPRSIARCARRSRCST